MPTPASLARRFRFGVFEFDPRAGELRRRGLKVRVRGRPLDILAILLERRPDVVTREELRERLWAADTFVDFDHGLNAAVNKLRDALGDTAENPRFVETVPRRGYRFISPVDSLDANATPAARSEPETQLPEPVARTPDVPLARLPPRSWRTWLGPALLLVGVAAALAALWPRGPAAPAGATAASNKVLLAVLPFENLSGNADQEYFSDGLTEELIAQLGALSPDRLGVIARTSIMQYKRSKKDVGRIGEELGVGYVLEGSVRRAGDRVRITAQLVQVTDQTQLWAESYDRGAADVLGIQSEVAMKVARALAMEILDAAARRPRAVANVFAAYESYMRGRFYREQVTEKNVRRAIGHFEGAIALDAAYAPAYAGLADAYRLLTAAGWEVERPGDLLPKARAAAARALELDPRLADAHAVLAMVRFDHDWDIAGAEQGLRRALEINPSLVRAHIYYSGVLTAAGRFDEAIEQARVAFALDPMAPTAGTTLGIRFFYARRFDEAVAQFHRTLQANPSFPVAHWGLAECYWQLGRKAEALAQWTEALESSGGSAYMKARLAYGLAASDQGRRARALLDEIVAEGAGGRYVAPVHLAMVNAGLGETDRALDALERGYEDRSSWMMFLDVERAFDGLRENPRFRALRARVRR